jgi:hypothetical protein
MLKETNNYRFGPEGDYGTRSFEAGSLQEAWNKGRATFSWRGGSRLWSNLEREYVLGYSPPVILSSTKDGLSRRDLQEETRVWVRVAAGFPDSGWMGEPPGGAVLYSWGGTVQKEIGPGHDPVKALAPYTEDKDFIREAILGGIALHDASPYAGTEFSVWIIFDKNKCAADDFGIVWVSTTRENWENVLRDL